MSCEEHWIRALELLPTTTTDGLDWHSRWLFGQGRREEALALARKAAELDPRSPIVLAAVGHHYASVGRFDESFTVYDQPFVIVFENTKRLSAEEMLALFNNP